MERETLNGGPEVNDDTDYDYRPATAVADEPPQVSSAIAVIRIIAVLAIGFCVSLGIFLMLFGGKGIILGGVLILLAIPCYFGMQFAERIAASRS